MKFKVGDKIRSIDNNYGCTRKNMEFIGEVIEVLDNGKWIRVKTLSSRDKEKIGMKYGVQPSHFELVEEPTEFTFQEIVARNIPGIYVNCSDASARVKSILIRKDGSFGINANFRGIIELGIIGINHNLKFKLKESKKRLTIYKVEHKKDGKKYDFISSQRLEKEMFVVCDTSQGKSYGRIVDVESRELTEEECKQYKECWRA